MSSYAPTIISRVAAATPGVGGSEVPAAGGRRGDDAASNSCARLSGMRVPNGKCESGLRPASLSGEDEAALGVSQTTSAKPSGCVTTRSASEPGGLFE